jgi:hypothetical protein
MSRTVHALGGRALGAAALWIVLALCATLPTPAAIRPNDPVSRYAEALQEANGHLTPAARYDLAQRFLLLASYYRIDPALLMAIVTVESSWHARAISPVGALGYGQLMPATAARLDVDPLEPYENLDGTARYLRRLLNRYAGRGGEQRVRLAVASYNAGPGAVDRYGGIPPYRETQTYVLHVLHWRSIYAALAGAGRIDVAHVLAHGVPQHPHGTPALVADPPAIVWATLPDRHPYHRLSFGVAPPDPYETPAPVPQPKRGFFSHLFGRWDRAHT